MSSIQEPHLHLGIGHILWLKGAELWQALAIQTGWLFLTWFIARAMWHRGLRHYQAVGG